MSSLRMKILTLPFILSAMFMTAISKRLPRAFGSTFKQFSTTAFINPHHSSITGFALPSTCIDGAPYTQCRISSYRIRSLNNCASDELETSLPLLEEFIGEATAIDDFFASPGKFPDFQSIGINSSALLQRIRDTLTTKDSLTDVRPSAIQAASFTAITSGGDVTIGAETGSGKTLAYLLPLIDDVLVKKKEAKKEDGKFGHLGYDYGRAVILVPNKELVNQVVRMAVKLCGGSKSIIWNTNGESFVAEKEGDALIYDSEIVRLGVLPGGLKTPEDYKPFRLGVNDPMNTPPLDLIVTTPASLGPMALNPKNIELFADIQTLVIDEADMLLDGGYLRQLENVLLGFKRADRLDSSFGVIKTQHILVAATLPNMGLKSADAYVRKKFPYATQVTMKGMHNARHYGLKDNTEWIEDDYNEKMPKRRRMEKLIEILKVDSSHGDSFGLSGEKVMIFLNSVSEVDNASSALLRAGFNAVPFHAKIPVSERTGNLSRFRKYHAHRKNEDDAVPILICTDLASRGLDIPGVTSVVQLQFSGNVVSHLHRMGRCGRAGNKDGRGIIFYGGIERDLVEVVRQAEHDQQTMQLKGNDIAENVHDEGSDKIHDGKVQNAFSRRRGFTKKKKKIAKKSNEEEYYENF